MTRTRRRRKGSVTYEQQETRSSVALAQVTEKAFSDLLLSRHHIIINASPKTPVNAMGLCIELRYAPSESHSCAIPTPQGGFEAHFA